MKRITVILLVLSVVFVLLNFYLKTDLFLILSITFCTALYHFAMRLFVGEICNKFIEPKLNYNAKWFNEKKFEKELESYSWIDDAGKLIERYKIADSKSNEIYSEKLRLEESVKKFHIADELKFPDFKREMKLISLFLITNL